MERIMLGNKELQQNVQDTIESNKRQSVFYNTKPMMRDTNLATELWKATRRPCYRLLDDANIWKDIFTKHMNWMGDLGGKKVLDLGCSLGNILSFKIAKGAGEYLGVDLSEPAIAELQRIIEERGIENAQGIAVDFLSPDFVESGFDLCYAQGVLHHFKHFDAFLEVLASKLNEGAVVVSCDPLKTSIPARIARGLYRPFQLNKDWEWPFTKETFPVIEKYFEIEEIQGFIGASMRAFPLAFIKKNTALSYVQKMHQRDMECANKISSDLWRCMQVTMKLRKK